MDILYILILAITVNLDSFITGMSYSIKGIKVPIYCRLLISLLTVLLAYITVHATSLLSSYISDNITSYIGAGILFVMGIGVILKSIFEKKKEEYYLEKADYNKSKTIELPEAILLMVALSIDNIFISIATGFTGKAYLMYILPAIIGIMQYTLFSLGNKLGNKVNKFMSKYFSENTMNIISGVIFILIGISRLF